MGRTGKDNTGLEKENRENRKYRNGEYRERKREYEGE